MTTSNLSTTVEIVGLGLVVIGVYLIFPPAAFIVAGLGLVALGYALGASNEPPS